MVTDLVQIRRLGEKKREENHRLRLHLKRHEHVERRLKRIAQDVEDQVDCTACANCCRVATTRLQERDVEKLAKHLRLSREKFLAEYTEVSEEEGLILKRNVTGCIFLDGNLCSIYEARPSTCVGFPHLVRGAGSLIHRMWQMIDRACYCPIVYNSLERFKDEVGFLRRQG
jgi:Fe-S-cluster containining protein